MDIVEVTDYDVLAERQPGPRYVLDRYKKHIGNTRFGVLVDLYREAYGTVQVRGILSECDKIIDRIVGVTCHRDVAIAVNKGRFLVRESGKLSWVRLHEEESKELVRQVLNGPLTASEEPLQDDLVASTAFSAMNLGWVDLPPPPVNNDNDDSINDKKRGRRRSLLRRSASESTMMDDKKKLHIRGLGLDTTAVPTTVQESDDFDPDSIEMGSFFPLDSNQRVGPVTSPLSRQSSAPPVITRTSEQIKEWKGMDVVLSASGRMLSSKEVVVGNNRLTVLVSLQKGRYQSLSEEEQDKVAVDLLRAVCHYWGGRVLVDQGYAYAKLNENQAITAMKNLLCPETAQTIMVSTAAPSKPLLSAPPVPDFLREASMEILTSNGVNTGDPQSMQNQAVKSLQARKAKRTMTKSLGRGQALSTTPEL
eukprot:Nitzschia sp. Nitz4//scaffold38_size140716//85838//87100//NITZ4_003149-RA/size140716-processed-gene-0.34-mRNA-1//1//CDS//3329550084//3998//frame0